jgi:hypothetical protein
MTAGSDKIMEKYSFLTIVIVNVFVSRLLHKPFPSTAGLNSEERSLNLRLRRMK